DEQHRFGLEQRVQLRRKNEATHLLNMSATPIPRTMAITLYGDMDISRIREKPCGRLPVKTLVMSEARKGAVFNSMEKYIRQGRQCYYVVPMIEPNDDLELESVESAYAEICERFRAENCALMHGRLSAEQKQDIMSRFSGGEVSVLVSTTVIEVGIDVPNATVIVIRHPERFGLAQLHQLRGRVGRGTEQSFCVLLHDEDIGEAARERLDILEKSDDGFEIAEKDLSLRGAGTLTGSVQSGFSSEFIFADIYADVDLLCQAREDAEELIRSTDAAVIRKLSDASGAAAILS
ncbi:MAG: helicase-related protein, partial [Spirochaetota bacterium]